MDISIFELQIAVLVEMMMLSLLILLEQVGLLYAEYVEYQASLAGPLDVFQVYQPVTFAPQSDNGCNLEVLLMEHVFGASYGKPFVGEQWTRKYLVSHRNDSNIGDVQEPMCPQIATSTPSGST